MPLHMQTHCTHSQVSTLAVFLFYCVRASSVRFHSIVALSKGALRRRQQIQTNSNADREHVLTSQAAHTHTYVQAYTGLGWIWKQLVFCFVIKALLSDISVWLIAERSDLSKGLFGQEHLGGSWLVITCLPRFSLIVLVDTCYYNSQ